MRLLYAPLPNLVARTALRPVARFLPQEARFPVAGRIRVRPPGGRPFTLACNPTSYLGKVVFWGGAPAFEPEVLPVFRHLVADAATFVDVGANIGYYSLLAASYNPDIEAVAFEPSPGPFEYLRRNCAANGPRAITAVNSALGDHTGTVEFYPARNPRYPGVAQLGGTGSVDESQASFHGAADRVEARLDTLDAYVDRAPGIRRVDVVKIDVEGAERAVLEGASGVIERDRPGVLFESLPQSDDLAEILSFFDRRGYRVYLATADGLVRSGSGEAGADGWTNYVAVAEDGAASVTPLLAPV